MLPVEIYTIQESLVLRARGSELLILAHHARHLQGLKAAKEFCAYFLNDALVNRPARKLFEAWLRKDSSLWRRIYEKIQNEMTFSESEESAETAKVSEMKPASKDVATQPSEEKPVAKKKAASKKPAKETSLETAPEKDDVEVNKTKKKAATKTSPKEKVVTKKTATKSASTSKKTTKKKTT